VTPGLVSTFTVGEDSVAHFATERRFVAEQYSDAAKLRIRTQTHERFSEGTETFVSDVLNALGLASGQSLLDVGCGDGSWHPRVVAHGVSIVGVDLMAGMLREASGRGAQLLPRPTLAQADAQALPFANNHFDHVLCCGVLYHVPDREHALREMRRVLRPGGRAVISTNGADAMRRIYQLHGNAARQLGYEPLPLVAGHFTMDDLPLVRSVFPAAERHVLEGALAFPTAEPALRFYATSRIDAIQDRPADGSHRARLLPLVRDQIAAIIAAEGVFRVPKSVGWFVADVTV